MTLQLEVCMVEKSILVQRMLIYRVVVIIIPSRSRLTCENDVRNLQRDLEEATKVNVSQIAPHQACIFQN